MIAQYLLAIGVTIVLAEGRLEKGPPVEVDRDWDNAVELVVDSSEVPDGANVVHIAAMKLSDLTGDVYEPGYYFGYSSLYPKFIYPNLNMANEYVFKIRYSDDGDTFSEWSDRSAPTKTFQSREEIFQTARSWREAKNECEASGMRLAVINNKRVNSRVTALMEEANVKQAWIGLYDANFGNNKDSTNWVWIDDSKLRYTAFSYLPKTSDVALSAVAISVDGAWDHRNPADKLPFVCQHSPQVDIVDNNGINGKAILKATAE